MRLLNACLLGLLLAGCGSSLSSDTTSAAPATTDTVASSESVAARAVGPNTVSLAPGWNPVAFEATSLSALNATGVAGMAFYSGGQTRTGSFTLAEVTAGEGPRRGFWVFATAAGNLTYSGDDAPAATLNLSAGWNMVSFCTTASLGSGDLTIRRNGTVVTPGSSILVYELAPDRTTRLVDLSGGGRLLPGRPSWVYATEALTIQVTGTGVPAPSPTPTPSATPTPAASPSPSAASGDISRLTSKFNNGVGVAVTTTDITFTSQSQPDHKSAYWPTSNPLYELFSSAAFRPNLGTIQPVGLTIRVPRFPREANPKTATPMGPIGISRNGVPFYNQYAANFQPLTMELAGMDQGNGHPNPNNQYHYHLEPLLIEAVHGKDAFLGLLTDGFPVYGGTENGRTMQNSDLDAYHGHFGVTADFPEGIYHYHFTTSDPYLNGGSFYGVPGTSSR